MTQIEPSFRRHDLDALRAFAMLLGIGLHAGLSFTPFFWPVQDTRQSDLFGLGFAAIHGFRMPLFFLLSGFFTAMLWRKRGLKSLLGHRFKRVFLPLLLCLITIVPAVTWIGTRAWESSVNRGGNSKENARREDNIWSASAAGNRDALIDHLTRGADVNMRDPALGVTPLSWATLFGQTETVTFLIEKGADVNGTNRDGSTPGGDRICHQSAEDPGRTGNRGGRAR